MGTDTPTTMSPWWMRCFNDSCSGMAPLRSHLGPRCIDSETTAAGSAAAREPVVERVSLGSLGRRVPVRGRDVVAASGADRYTQQFLLSLPHFSRQARWYQCPG